MIDRFQKLLSKIFISLPKPYLHVKVADRFFLKFFVQVFWGQNEIVFTRYIYLVLLIIYSLLEVEKVYTFFLC